MIHKKTGNRQGRNGVISVTASLMIETLSWYFHKGFSASFW